MSSIVENKDLLRALVDRQVWCPAEETPFNWAMSLMPNLRSPDPELRDTLTYGILVNLLVAHALTPDEVATLLDLAVSREYLFYRIGETGTDSVFARSFGALVVAAVVEVDAADRHLSPTQLGRIIDAVTTYAKAERDHRGFVDGKGWAHAVAHVADALDSCAQHPYATTDQHTVILDTVGHLAAVASPLVHGEDDRLAFVALRLAKRDGGDIDWLKWLARFEVTSNAGAADDLPLGNIGHFLRAFHVMLHWELPTWVHTDAVLNRIREVHGFYRYGTLPLK